MNDLALASVFASLGHEERVDVVASALAQSPEFIEIVKEYERDETLGQAPSAVQDALTASVMRLIEPLMPALGEKLKEVAGPATERAMAVAIPRLKEQIPLYAAITGIVAGALVLGGMYLAKRM